ncbi:MAG TPA: GGDEF domain-containing protein [Candidatus Angelobacter sp.]|nr:GGDEF domain-containing protein [Candidatus Angelobacter sp.]
MKVARLLYRLTVPGGIVLLLAFALLRLGIVNGTEGRQINLYPAVVFAAGLILSAVFHRSRLFLALLVVGVSHAAMVTIAPWISPEAQRVLSNAIAFLVPLNLLALSFLQDRGIISPAGERRLACIGLQGVAVALLMLPRFAAVAALLSHLFVARHFSDWSRVPQPALVVFALAAGVISVSLARRYQAAESSLFWGLISIFIALRAGATSYQGALYFGVAGLLFTIAVLETSHSMAFRDELTRLPSRRAFNEALLKLENSYTIAMLDVDHFKRFNDTYGHAAGDQALRLVASRLAHVTGGGKAYRYGGEEFAVVFPGIPAEEAFTYLDRMRRLIEQSRFVVRAPDRRGPKGKKKSRHDKTETNVTVSVGIAASHGNQVAVDQILRSADQALYKAKAKGRNCTVVARPPKPKKSADFSMRILQVE